MRPRLRAPRTFPGLADPPPSLLPPLDRFQGRWLPKHRKLASGWRAHTNAHSPQPSVPPRQPLGARRGSLETFPPAGPPALPAAPVARNSAPPAGAAQPWARRGASVLGGGLGLVGSAARSASQGRTWQRSRTRNPHPAGAQVRSGSLGAGGAGTQIPVRQGRGGSAEGEVGNCWQANLPPPLF